MKIIFCDGIYVTLMKRNIFVKVCFKLSRKNVTLTKSPFSRLNRINNVLIPTSCNFFSGSPSLKNSKVKRVWPREI